MTPRYILPSNALADIGRSFEFPVQALSRSKPCASVVVTALTFTDALRLALNWAEKFSTTQHKPVYPRVSYRDKGMMVKKLSGPDGLTAYVENASHGAWVPVAVLSL